MTPPTQPMAPSADAAILALEFVDRALREIAAAIEHEINVRQCAHDSEDGINALRWCLDMVNDA